MIQFDTLKVSLPLKKTFAVSGGSADIKTNVLTVLNNRYFGEAAASVKYGPGIEKLQEDVNKGIELLASRKSLDTQTLLDINEFDIHPIARSALIAMVLNYISGETQRYPWEILSLSTPVGIKSSMTVAIDNPIAMIEAIRKSDFPIIKVKMGGEGDATLLQAFQTIENKEIRVDANAGWSCEQAEEMIFFLSRAGVRIIEQPTSAEFVKEWPHLKGKCDVELIMDEGLNSFEDYQNAFESVDGINIKMEKSGGILEAARIAINARKDGKKVMLGCMVESSVGIAQSVYMSSLADYYDLDGPHLLEHDIAQGINYNRESIEVDREIIGGPRLLRDVVEKYISE
ncbi:MAG: enolase C-terminal domain-like protein [candidate division Zixibacteria bacterium]|nr:enolase C-terminal domain-like protein [candidate division Zixibacteria bacterium]